MLYAVILVLFATGIFWAWARYLVPEPTEFLTICKSNALKIHGAFAMIILVMLGGISSTHVRAAWRARRNRTNGVWFLTLIAMIVVSGYGLYYFGDETLRAWTSWIHLGAGLLFPIFLIAHIFLGRKTRARQSRPSAAKFGLQPPAA